MEITNSALRAYPYCHHKAYLELHRKKCKKLDYNVIQEELLHRYYPLGVNKLTMNIGEKRILTEHKNRIGDLAKGYEIILNFNLTYDNYKISYDGLKLQKNTPSETKPVYSPVIIMPKERIMIEDKLFMVMISLLFGEFQGAFPVKSYVIYGKNQKTLSVKVETYLQRGKNIIEEITKLTRGKYNQKFLLNKHCSICDFSHQCVKEAKERNDLSTLKTLSVKEIQKLNNRGIFTVEQFSYKFRPRKVKNKSIHRKRIRHHSLQALAIREDKIFIVDKIKFKLMPVQIYIDAEGLPDEGYVYLIGMAVIDNPKGINTSNGGIKKLSFWGDTPEEEIKIFEQFIKEVSKYCDYQILHYGSYETRLFKRMLKILPEHHKAINEIINNSVNVTSLIYKHIYLPTYSNGLKDIGKYFKYTWSDPEASGIQSIYWRKKWEITRKNYWKNKLVEYNYEDCTNLAFIVREIKAILDNVNNNEDSKVFLAESLENLAANQQYRNRDFYSESFKYINKASYFDYQRERVFFRTHPSIRRYHRRKKKKKYIRTNEYIHFRIKKCIYCKNYGLKVLPGERWFKYALDIKFTNGGVKRWKVSYYSDKYYCERCEKSFYAPKLKKAKYRYLYNLKAWIVYHYVVNKLSFVRIAQYTNDLFGYDISFQRVLSIKKEMAQYYKLSHNKILKKICSGNILHIDETPIQLQDRRGYVWVLTSFEDVCYIYQESREINFLKSLLKNFSGVMVSDFYPGYDAIDCQQQKCLVHLIRNLNDDLYKHPYDSELKTLMQSFSALLKTIIGTIDRYGLRKKYLKRHKRETKKFLNSLSGIDMNSEIANKYKRRFEKFEEKLFTFLDFDGIPWNNNNAERAIKAFAKWRYLIKGQIQKIGVEDFCILLSIHQTCNYKGINFLEFLLSKNQDIEKYSMKL